MTELIIIAKLSPSSSLAGLIGFILNLPMISCSYSSIYVAAAPIYVAAALEKYQNIWIEVFAKLSPSSSQIQLQLGLSLALFPNYPTTRPPHPTRPDHPTAGIVDFSNF